MKISVVIPTLAADDALEACVESLRTQTLPAGDFEVIVVDNSGRGLAARFADRARVLANASNNGYGGGVNQGILASAAGWILALNDDTVADPECLKRLLRAGEERREIGMCAPRILRAGSARIDSAGGLLIAPDGTSKQRGQGRESREFDRDGETLLPSGCAALYRREMLDEIGLFEESYFLYCEDTDLGLRARWQAWECVYAAGAIVEHRYSHSTGGGASALKAYYVERNRLRTVVRNFPIRDLLLSPFHTAVRYWWHLRMKDGSAAQYQGVESLAAIALRAWKDALFELPELWKQRRGIQARARLGPKQFSRLLSSYRISSKQVAAL